MSFQQNKRKIKKAEKPFIFFAKNSYRTERKLWEFKDKEGKELGRA
jgi:hypothetical protein